MEINGSNEFGELSPDALASFEKEIGHKLPSEYRDYLLRHNGGRPHPSSFRISESQGDSGVHHMFGLHAGPDYLRLDRAYVTYLGRMPSNVIPIADDPCGNALCICISGPKAGRVLFWDHEFEADEAEYWGNLTEIAESFSAFLGELSEWVDPNETELERAVKADDVIAVMRALDRDASIDAEDAYGRTMIENAAIHNSTNVITYLHTQGAKLRNALSLAEQNAEFFPEHQRAVELLRSLTTKA